MKHKFNLKETGNKQKVWYCISCEKIVTRHVKGKDSINLRSSYFIYVHPNNARICASCLGKTIKIGSTDQNFDKMTRKEYDEVCGE